MSLWTRIQDAIEALSSGSSLSDVLERLTRPPEKTVAFTIAVIGLGAKMAKADGQVTRDEVTAFRRIFHIDQADEADAARIFNLARQDVRGYDGYARSVARMFRNDDKVLIDLLEGLFQIAAADGEKHPLEMDFLSNVAEIFGIGTRQFEAIKSRAFPGSMSDPYVILGVSRDDSFDVIRARWQQIVRETHPDQMIARGVPEEAIKIATARMAAVNEAWDAIRHDHAA